MRLATELSAQNKDEVQLHFSLGILLASEKQYKPAELELEKADALQPGTFEILYNLGQAYLRDGANPKAELVLNRALKLKPDSPDALYLLAQVYSNESRPLDALDLLVRAHKIAPENTDVILSDGPGQYVAELFRRCDTASGIWPRHRSATADLQAALGESYFMAGKVDKAIEAFQQLIKIDPSARSYVYLGVSYRLLGRFDEAKQYFQEGLKLDPHNSACLFNLGFIAERQGDYASAETLFQQALRYNPDSADALLELANLRIVE